MLTTYTGFVSGPLFGNNIYYALEKVCINVRKFKTYQNLGGL